MSAEHPRDVDPSITGQPHQVTGKDPDLMGIYRGRLVTGRKCQRRHQSKTVSPQPMSGGLNASKSGPDVSDKDPNAPTSRPNVPDAGPNG